MVASVGLGGTVWLHDVASGALADTLASHRAAVWGLAWAGTVLVSVDADGETALWDLDDRVGAGSAAR